ncbi:MAG: DUF374 domain-containing protein [Pseudoruegeria sp.]
MSIRKRISNSPKVNGFVARQLARYIQWVWRTSKFESHGFETLNDLATNGEPVIAALLHQRLVMSPFLFPPRHKAPICSITSSAKAGKLAGYVQKEFDFETVPLRRNTSQVALTRAIVKNIQRGMSVGFAIDGPSGPARQASTVPLIWSRMTGKQVFLVSFSVEKYYRLNTWDGMIVPKAYNKGVLLCEPLNVTIPKKASPEAIEAARLELETRSNALAEKADKMCGHVSPIL